jgi:hypothetical protein
MNGLNSRMKTSEKIIRELKDETIEITSMNNGEKTD